MSRFFEITSVFGWMGNGKGDGCKSGGGGDGQDGCRGG